MLAVLSITADEKLIGLALRIVLSDHVRIPAAKHSGCTDRSGEHLRSKEAQGGHLKERSSEESDTHSRQGHRQESCNDQAA